MGREKLPLCLCKRRRLPLQKTDCRCTAAACITLSLCHASHVTGFLVYIGRGKKFYPHFAGYDPLERVYRS
jgi:hypothetical protein